MPVGVNVLRNYINAVNTIEKYKPKFQSNLSKNIAYSIDSLAMTASPDFFYNVFEKINKAPHSLYKTLTSFFFSDKPSSLSELQTVRKNIKMICRKDKEANEYMKSIKSYIAENPDVRHMLRFVGKGIKKFINLGLDKKLSLKDGVKTANIYDFLESSKRLMAGLEEKNLSSHLQEFLDYVIKK